MLKIIGGVFLGFLLSSAGVYMGYLFLRSLETGTNFILAIASIILGGIGIYILIRSSKSDASVVKKADLSEQINHSQSSGMSTILEKNNELIKDWNRTGEMRDKLKMMQIAAVDEENKPND